MCNEYDTDRIYIVERIYLKKIDAARVCLFLSRIQEIQEYRLRSCIFVRICVIMLDKFFYSSVSSVIPNNRIRRNRNQQLLYFKNVGD